MVTAITGSRCLDIVDEVVVLLEASHGRRSRQIVLVDRVHEAIVVVVDHSKHLLGCLLLLGEHDGLGAVHRQLGHLPGRHQGLEVAAGCA